MVKLLFGVAPLALLLACTDSSIRAAHLGLLSDDEEEAGDGTSRTSGEEAEHGRPPERVEATPERIATLRVRAGLALSVFARGLDRPRTMVVGDDGVVYVAEPRAGRLLALVDRDGDGSADERYTVASGLASVHGLALRGDRLFVAQTRKIWSAVRLSKGSLGPLELLVDDLPEGGLHPLRTIAFGPDGALYVSIGSGCNACAERDPERGTLLRLEVDDAGHLVSRGVFARGLRDLAGFAWHPDTHVLWGMDRGTDGRGDDAAPEELDRVEAGQDYGWPWIFGRGEPDLLVADPPGATKIEWARRARAAVRNYQAHSAPAALVFYAAEMFPPEYRGDAIVAMHGSIERTPPAGFEVVRVRFDDRGEPSGFEPLLSGFLLEGGRAELGRPAGLAVDRAGALLVSDDENGMIYRVRAEPPPL